MVEKDVTTVDDCLLVGRLDLRHPPGGCLWKQAFGPSVIDLIINPKDEVMM